MRAAPWFCSPASASPAKTRSRTRCAPPALATAARRDVFRAADACFVGYACAATPGVDACLAARRARVQGGAPRGDDPVVSRGRRVGADVFRRIVCEQIEADDGAEVVVVSDRRLERDVAYLEERLTTPTTALRLRASSRPTARAGDAAGSPRRPRTPTRPSASSTASRGGTRGSRTAATISAGSRGSSPVACSRPRCGPSWS